MNRKVSIEISNCNSCPFYKIEYRGRHGYQFTCRKSNKYLDDLYLRIPDWCELEKIVEEKTDIEWLDETK